MFRISFGDDGDKRLTGSVFVCSFLYGLCLGPYSCCASEFLSEEMLLHRANLL